MSAELDNSTATCRNDRGKSREYPSDLFSVRNFLRDHADQVGGAFLVSHSGDVPVSVASHVRNHCLGRCSGHCFGCRDQAASVERRVGRTDHNSTQDARARRSLRGWRYDLRPGMGAHGSVSGATLRSRRQRRDCDDRCHCKRAGWNLAVRIVTAEASTLDSGLWVSLGTNHGAQPPTGVDHRGCSE